MLNLLRKRIDTFKAAARNVHYIQGQSPKPNIREYFYYIDHHGQVNFLRVVFKPMINVDRVGSSGRQGMLDLVVAAFHKAHIQLDHVSFFKGKHKA